jgi:hypothetical protein
MKPPDAILDCNGVLFTLDKVTAGNHTSRFFTSSA